MKTLLISLLLIISASALSQNQLDTVYGRFTTMQAQDWAVSVALVESRDDSTFEAAVRKIRAAYAATSNPTWTTNVTIDSLPGKYLMAIYRKVKFAPAGSIANRYTAITNAINSKANLLPYTNAVDTELANIYTRYRTIGKNVVVN